jgi:S1/P1 Nuclease
VKRRFLAIILMALTASPSPLFGWNGLGHMTVAYVAYQHLNPGTQARAYALLKLNPDYSKWLKTIPKGTSLKDRRMMIFMIAATWPDQIKSEKGYTDDGSDGGNRPDGATSSLNVGYKDKLHHKYWHFVDTPFSDDGTALPAIPTPNAQTQIDVFRTVLSSNKSNPLKSYDLAWLLHLVGDVHQPLHATTRVSHDSPDGDSGGNDVMLCAKPCKEELHAFWDDLLGSSSKPSDAITAGKALPEPDSSLAANTDTAVWIKESFDDAKSTVYVSPIGTGDGPFSITEAYQDAAKQLAQQRIALAGVRLANVLNAELK